MKQVSPTPCASLRSRLRSATQRMHTDVERRLELDRPRWTALSYRLLLERFWGFYAPLEQRLAAIDWQRSGIAFAARRKAPWLEDDLLHFGRTAQSIADLSRCRDLPRLDDVAAGLGALYVLEGSTLGGQVILRTLRTQLGLAPDCGGRFFGSYGGNVGVMWREYLAVLERHGEAPDAAAAITQSAVETFAAFDRWFCATGMLHDEDARRAHV